jgi:hypothetical protein
MENRRILVALEEYLEKESEATRKEDEAEGLQLIERKEENQET